MSQQIAQHLIIILMAGVFLGILSWSAKKEGFYRLPPVSTDPAYQITFLELIGVFLVFMGMELFFMPLLVILWQWFSEGAIDLDRLKMNITERGWWNLTAVISAVGAIILYTYSLGTIKRQFMFWGPIPCRGVARRCKDALLGIATWGLSYPIIVAIGQVVALALIFMGPIQHHDQVAVKHLKRSLANPLLFWSSTFLVIFIVPIGEEILFRGFLQRWLIQQVGRFKGIILASICFALFHFSFSQKWDNIDLILSLFALSCYLGFIYERQQTLLAPISLHMTFNAISIAMLLFGERNG